jgi:MFS family permease
LDILCLFCSSHRGHYSGIFWIFTQLANIFGGCFISIILLKLGSKDVFLISTFVVFSAVLYFVLIPDPHQSLQKHSHFRISLESSDLNRRHGIKEFFRLLNQKAYIPLFVYSSFQGLI